MSSPSVAALVGELAGMRRALGGRAAEGNGRTEVHRLARAVMFLSRRSQLIARIAMPSALIALVVEGRKGVLCAGERHMLAPGDVLVVPPGVVYDATTTPDRRSGAYRALCVFIEAEVGAMLARRHPALCASPSLGSFDPCRIHVLGGDVVVLQALLHCVRTLAVAAHGEVLRHRIEDVLLSLSLQHAREPDPLGADMILAVRRLVRSAPDEPWPAELVARRLAMSAATLRRRLGAAGTSLRQLRAEERMLLAASLLTAPGARVDEVAARCGYQSPSKFARQYRRWFGAPPGARSARPG